MTDAEKIQALREGFSKEFSIVGPHAFRIAMVDPDTVARWFLTAVRDIDKGETTMKDILILVSSGGLESPQYEILPEDATDVDAHALAEFWGKDMQEGDTIDILRIDLTTRTIEKVGGK